MPIPHILIIEKDHSTRNIINVIFQTVAYSICEVHDVIETENSMPDILFDALFIDIDSINAEAINLIKTWQVNQPKSKIIVMIDSLQQIQNLNKINLTVDTILKPMDPKILVTTLQKLLKVPTKTRIKKNRRYFYQFCGWRLDLNTHLLISPQKEEYRLPRSEFHTLLHFCRNPGKLQSRSALLKKMTKRHLHSTIRTVDVTIRRLRRYFESIPGTPEIITTVHGEGYLFSAPLEP